MAATSVHKLGGSMTQSSILNFKSKLVSPKRVQSILSMLTTTSTSYILLASLDSARKQLAVNGNQLMDSTISLARYIRTEINGLKPLYCAGEELLDGKAAFDYDPTKLIISVKNLGITGYDAELWLRETHNIEVELSDLYNILCIITPGDSEKEAGILIRALKELVFKFTSHAGHHKPAVVLLPEIPTLALSPREAFYSETEVVKLEESAGRIISEFIMVYPPGIPILLPGEVITEENLKYIEENLQAGLPVQGPEDSSLTYISVIKE